MSETESINLMHRTKEKRAEDFIQYIKHEYQGRVGSFYEFEKTVIDFLNGIQDSYEHGEEWRKISHNPHAHHTDGPADEDAYRRGYEQGAWHAVQGEGPDLAAGGVEPCNPAVAF